MFNEYFRQRLQKLNKYNKFIRKANFNEIKKARLLNQAFQLSYPFDFGAPSSV